MTSLTSWLFEKFSHHFFHHLWHLGWRNHWTLELNPGSFESTSCPKTCFTKSMGVLLLRNNRHHEKVTKTLGDRHSLFAGQEQSPQIQFSEKDVEEVLEFWLFHSLHGSMIYSFTVAPGVFGIRLGLATKPQYPEKKKLSHCSDDMG